jgi:hypothetical protein
MKRFIIILICALGIQLYAVEYTPFASNRATAPAAAMHSVNNTTHMASGSTYTPAVYAVGASAPSHGPRKVGPPSVTPETPADVDPANTNYGPVGDAVIPLILMVMAYAAYILLKRRKAHAMP